MPLVTFCRPSRWRDCLDQLFSDLHLRQNIVLEADSLSLQLRMVQEASAHALLGSYAIEAALAERRIQAARLANPAVPRYMALAMAPHGEMTLACRTVMQEIKRIATEQAQSQPQTKMQEQAQTKVQEKVQPHP